MSASLQAYLSTLFGKHECSDCDITFATKESESAEKNKRPALDSPEHRPKRAKIVTGKQLSEADEFSENEALDEHGADADTEPSATAEPTNDETLGSPVPAHALVLRGGSQRFRAQFERWVQEQQQPGGRPQLRVLLDRAEDLPAALAALKFIYTSKLDVSSAREVLDLRRIGAYLLVDGCADACDASLKSVVLRSSTTESQAEALGGVMELHSCRQLMPVDEPLAVQSLMHACRQQLLKHSASGKIEGKMPAGSPSLGELLGWAFGDAPSVLSDPEIKRQAMQLSAAALEALLASNTFATDSEATVLLLVAEWLQANANTPEATRHRLCKLVRLSHVGDCYLFSVLHALTWFPLSAEEHRFLCRYVHADSQTRERLCEAAEVKYDSSSSWYSAAARPSASKREYGWGIKADDLQAKIAKGEDIWLINGKFSNTASRVVAHGFEWFPGFEMTKASNSAGVYLHCTLPAALKRASSSGSMTILASPGAVRLSVYCWGQNGSRQEAYGSDYDGDFVGAGTGWGSSEVLPLAAQDATLSQQDESRGAAGAGASSAALLPWAAYLRDGMLSGALSWR